ncbi:hypothetical protein T440DRAFT_527291 [Plenodomus tracheiphilus IPT5]|uniref:Uncharacterized protein n=1 Tax=Plenodomus tracheiphilus IPT5 TaxID=1408161 RepID=A0A6A7B8J8_9PLEO|nr:hypothetical protein T440DRAFT_527291 [Plenodomus tracheiphilus IPT5]
MAVKDIPCSTQYGASQLNAASVMAPSVIAPRGVIDQDMLVLVSSPGLPSLVQRRAHLPVSYCANTCRAGPASADCANWSQDALSGMANAAVRLGDIHTASCTLSDPPLLKVPQSPAQRSPSNVQHGQCGQHGIQVRWHTPTAKMAGVVEALSASNQNPVLALVRNEPPQGPAKPAKPIDKFVHLYLR